MKYLYLLISVLFIAGCTSNNTLGSFDEPTVSQSELFSTCLGFFDEKVRIMCAAAFNNASLCSELNGDDYIHCVIYAAAANKNVSACESIAAYVPDDCYTTVAMASLNNPICSLASSPNGCDYMVNITRASKTFEECRRKTGDYETECIFNYAWKLNDSTICDKLTNLMGFDTSCKAMISGNDSDCDPLKSVGVDEWYYCHIKAMYQITMPSVGVFNPDLCEDNEECQYYLLRHMINYAASQ
jgi:hypothetical protein